MNQNQEADTIEAIRSLTKVLDTVLEAMKPGHLYGQFTREGDSVRANLGRAKAMLVRMETRYKARNTPSMVDLTMGEVAVLATEPQHIAMHMVRDRLGLSLREALNVITAFQEKNGRRGELHEHYPFKSAPCAREGCSGKATDASPGASEELAYCSGECAHQAIADAVGGNRGH